MENVENGRTQGQKGSEKGPNQTTFFFFFFFFCLFRTAPTAYGGSLAKGPIGAVAAGLHHSHSHAGSEPHLQHRPQLRAMLDP